MASNPEEAKWVLESQQKGYSEIKAAHVSKDILLTMAETRAHLSSQGGLVKSSRASTLGNNILPSIVTALMLEMMSQRLKSQQKAEPPMSCPPPLAAVGRARTAGPSSPTRRTIQTTQVAFCSSVSDP